jgi:peptidoglycan/LPS O-acetylase OafA/YrhL
VLVRPARRAPSLRGDIQGMRALAVLLVLFAHAGIRGFAGGYRARPQAGPVIIRRRLNGSRGRAGAT